MNSLHKHAGFDIIKVSHMLIACNVNDQYAGVDSQDSLCYFLKNILTKPSYLVKYQ